MKSTETLGHADAIATAHPVPIVAAIADALEDQDQVLARARAFAQPLIASETLDTGENVLLHADAVAAIIAGVGGSQAMQAATYLVYACAHLNKPHDVITKAFGPSWAQLALETTKLVHVQRQTRALPNQAQLLENPAQQIEGIRKMLLAFSRDLRVVMLRLASRLQTLRYLAAHPGLASPALANESLQVFAPLANRLGIWQIKWEMEDLAFRLLEPEVYKSVARSLDEKRLERESFMAALQTQVQTQLQSQGLQVTVQGRPKHIYSIVKKMRGKALSFDQVFDIRALRVIAADIPACYAVLAWVQSHFEPVSGQFDDYIAKSKPNGYQSLHAVVRDDQGRAIEIQIRTQAMHDHAEHGVAAHWAYKEAGVKGYAGVSAGGDYDAKIAVLRQLLAWEQDLSKEAHAAAHLFTDRIYVLTPAAAVIELPQGATAIDFAYTVHTDLGHRCRGTRVDGVMLPLNTPLQNGQTIEIVAVKEGGPSRDWLNPELGFLVSHRAKTKVRAWFNAQALQETIVRGREMVEKLLQREGKTSLKLDELAARLGFKTADDLFEVVGKDELSLRTIEHLLKPVEPASTADDYPRAFKAQAQGLGSAVLVVGLDSVLTQLARCCKPVPPDAIEGFVTRGKGVSVHRSHCSNFKHMAISQPDRVIAVQWGQSSSLGKPSTQALYSVDLAIEALDRPGVLRDISEVFTREKVSVVGVQTQTVQDNQGNLLRLTFTVQVGESSRLGRVLAAAVEVSGVRVARRV